jgi:hypothetical protein
MWSIPDVHDLHRKNHQEPEGRGKQGGCCSSGWAFFIAELQAKEVVGRAYFTLMVETGGLYIT